MASKSKTNPLSFDDVDNDLFNTSTTLIPPPPPPPTNIKSKKKKDKSRSLLVPNPTNNIDNQSISTDINSSHNNNNDILSSNQLSTTCPITTTTTLTAANTPITKPTTTNFHTLNKSLFTKRSKNQGDKLLLAQAEMNKFNFMQISSDILTQTELTIEKNQQEEQLYNKSTNNVNDDNLSSNNRDRNRQYDTSTYDL